MVYFRPSFNHLYAILSRGTHGSDAPPLVVIYGKQNIIYSEGMG